MEEGRREAGRKRERKERGKELGVGRDGRRKEWGLG